MTLIEQLIAGALAGLLTVGTIGGCMELKSYIEEQAQREAVIIEECNDVIDGCDVDDLLSLIEER